MLAGLATGTLKVQLVPPKEAVKTSVCPERLGVPTACKTMFCAPVVLVPAGGKVITVHLRSGNVIGPNGGDVDPTVAVMPATTGTPFSKVPFTVMGAQAPPTPA